MSADELRRREDEARAARCDHLVLELAGFAHQLQRFGRSLPLVVDEPALRTHDSLIGWENSLRRALTDAQSEVWVESAREVARRVAAAERAASPRELDTSGVRLGGSGSAEPQAIMAMIADLRDNARRSELADQAAHLFYGGAAGAPRRDVVLAFQARVDAALEVQRLHDLAAEAVLEVAHIPTPAADQIRSRARLVSTPEELEAIQEEVAVLQDAATKASDAQFIEAAVRDVLSELGYSIDEGFALEDLGRSVAIGDHPDHPGYGMRVQINPQNRMVYTRLVADRDTTPEADAQAEQDSCAKVLAIAEKLEDHGVAAELAFERQPGDAAVERWSTSSPGNRRRRSKRGSTGRTRSA